MAISVRILCLNIVVLLSLAAQPSIESPESEWYAFNYEGLHRKDIHLLEPTRVRRTVETVTDSTPPPTAASITASTSIPLKNLYSNITIARIENSTSNPLSSTPSIVNQRIPNVGVNGSGILKTDNLPQVSDPISPERYNSSSTGGQVTPKVVSEPTIEVNPEDHLHNLTKTDYEYYHSTFIGQPDYFNELWANITKMQFAENPTLSSSYRRATTFGLNFDFPFYGVSLKNVTVATGGFIYTGLQLHNWLAATQYIAPLMANFDTRNSSESSVKIADDGHNFTVIWEKVPLQNRRDQLFTFAVVLRESGDIVFAYKDIPIPVQLIDEKEHPVKIGISDAYVNDRIVFLRHRKTIYEYHRINFLKHNITSGTVLKLHPNPTCLVYTTCSECVNHLNTKFECTWCPSMNICTSDIDRKKQEWLLRSCINNQLSTDQECFVLGNNTYSKNSTNTGYSTPSSIQNNTVLETSKALTYTKTESAHSSMGGIVVLLMVITLVGFASGWTFYAYKNPHTRSGQLLIKYRPSTWSWKRGEARYTAATIHM